MIWTIDDPELWRSLIPVSKSTYKSSSIQRALLNYQHRHDNIIPARVGIGYKGWEWDKIDAHAIIEGRLDVLQWIHKNRPYTSWCKLNVDFAAKYNRLDIIKWLYENRDTIIFGYTYGLENIQMSTEVKEWFIEKNIIPIK
jgi:hypothetical protein